MTHPQRDHGWEVEWRDACSDAEGHAVCDGVHVLSNVGQRLPQLQGRNAARMLNNLCTKHVKTALLIYQHPNLHV